MGIVDSESTPVESTPVVETAAEATPADQQRTTGPAMGHISRIALVFFAALVGGVLGWALIRQFDDSIAASEPIQQLMEKENLTTEEDAQVTVAIAEMKLQQTILSVALLGMALGACTGLGAGLTRKTPAAVARGIGAGVLLGAIFGSIGGYAGARIEASVIDRQVAAAVDPEEQMKWTMAAHGVEWALVGLGVGLAAGLAVGPIGSALRPAASAVGGGIVAAPLYSMLAAVWFPVARADTAVPVGGWNALFWTMCAAVLIGLAVSRTLAHAPDRRAAADVA